MVFLYMIFENYDKICCFRLLNANEISCIRTDLFKDLTSLTLLSLYDNNIRSLANGTFANLRSIKTLFVLLRIENFLIYDNIHKYLYKNQFSRQLINKISLYYIHRTIRICNNRIQTIADNSSLSFFFFLVSS